MSEGKRPIVVGITGASGAVFAVRLVDVLLGTGRHVHLSMSAAGREVMRQELDLEIDLERFEERELVPSPATPGGGRFARLEALGVGRAATEEPQVARGTLSYHHYRDYGGAPASGSHLTAGMVVCPCSGATLSAIANGTGGNLIHRAAEVHLKERRPLILVPRETPLSLVQIENMRRVAAAGAVVLPASPGWYHGVRSMRDLVDFVVARICDQLGVEHQLIRRWGGQGQ